MYAHPARRGRRLDPNGWERGQGAEALVGSACLRHSPGRLVTIRGLKAFALPLVDAATITNDATGAMVVDNGPPSPDRWGLATLTGKVSATLHGPATACF